MVWQVLEMLAEGTAWETIIEQFHDRITKDAIAEAVKLSGEAFLKHAALCVNNGETPTGP